MPMESLAIELPHGVPANASEVNAGRSVVARQQPLVRERALRVGAAPSKPALDPPPSELRAATVWFDYTDLVHYFDDNRLPTGIQRVQIGIFRASLAREPGAAAARIGTTAFDPQRRCWVVLPEALLASVCRAACNAGAGSSGDDDAWRALTGALRQAVATGQAAPFAPGDVLVNIGTSWWIPDYLRYVQHMQRERGLLYAPFVHDCIPLCVPETCGEGLVAQFSTWFAEAMRVADLVFANSAHTARDVVRLAPRGVRVEPRVVRLDARFDDGPQPGSVASARLDAITQARLGIRRPFALFVATVEVRKNHLFVFRCWQALVRRLGDAVPDLLCVGKQGWLVDYTLNWLRVHPELAHRVRLVGTLSDLDLAALYRSALFTVYCSHYEGWGLPVTESLCHGRVPLVVNHSSLPEAGGPFALYYAPNSQAEFCAGVERLLDPGERTTLEAGIRARYRPRGWSDVLAQIVDTAQHAPPRLRADMGAPAVRAGVLHRFARRPGDASDGTRSQAPTPAHGHALLYGLGWWSAEDWGCWSRHEQAHLLLRLPTRARVDLLYLVLKGGPAGSVVGLQVGADAAPATALAPNERRLAQVPLDPEERGRELLLTLSARPYNLLAHTEGRDSRDIGFGLEALAVVNRRDAVARLEVLEFVHLAA